LLVGVVLEPLGLERMQLLVAEAAAVFCLLLGIQLLLVPQSLLQLALGVQQLRQQAVAIP
jgi:hypothetical protein